jgi:hypothetical protein
MSMNFYAGKDFGSNSFGPADPAFDWDTALNIGAGNAGYVMAHLGFEVEHDTVSVEIGAFIAACEKHLAAAKANPSIQLNSFETRKQRDDGSFGPLIIECGLPEGYVERKVESMLAIAKAGLAHGATEMFGG